MNSAKKGAPALPDGVAPEGGAGGSDSSSAGTPGPRYPLPLPVGSLITCPFPDWPPRGTPRGA